MSKILKNRKYILVSLVVLTFFVLDRILKYLALGGKMVLVKNYNLALGIPMPNLWLHCFIVSLIIIILIYFLTKAIKEKKLLLITGYLLLITSCVSNLIDRIKFGYVIDYINLYFFYNNLSDILVWLGIILLVVSYLKKNNIN